MTTENKTPHYLGHRKRLKDKYKSSGLDSWHDYEALEYALSYAIPRKDTKPVSKELISRFKNISGVLNAGLSELKQINGISEHTALFIRLLRDIAKIYLKQGMHKKDLISSPDIAIDYLKTALKGSKDEEFHILFLDKKNHLICAEISQIGTVDKSVVYPRKIVERALHHHAVGVIAAHNHPGGSIKPSASDKEVTTMLEKALKTVDICLLDHIIISGSGYFSFKENGLI
jgi:DNA repair protein RadC